jgi:hypothetical protein
LVPFADWIAHDSLRGADGASFSRQVHPLLRIVRECSSMRTVKRHFYGIDKDKK